MCVQPHEPVTGSAPQTPPSGTSETASASPAGVKSGRKHLRLWVALVAGVAALLCLGGVGVAVLLYDKETKIERTAPDAVADNFLRAYLVNRNEKEVRLYTCKSGGDFTQLDAYRTDIQNRENRFSIAVQVTWEGLRVTTNGTQGTVDVDLTRAIQDGSEQATDRWRLAIVDADGWRVCGATKAS